MSTTILAVSVFFDVSIVKAASNYIVAFLRSWKLGWWYIFGIVANSTTMHHFV